jgi:hypothetical protein
MVDRLCDYCRAHSDVHALYVGHVGCIIEPLPGAQDARVTTIAVLIPLSHLCEQFLQHIIPAHHSCSLPPGMQVTLTGHCERQQERRMERKALQYAEQMLCITDAPPCPR